MKKILPPKDYRCTDELYWNSQRMSYCQGYTTPELVALWDSLHRHRSYDGLNRVSATEERRSVV